MKYHAALDLSQAGVAVVELGHDASEFPLVDVLAQQVLESGVPEGRLEYIRQHNWAAF